MPGTGKVFLYAEAIGGRRKKKRVKQIVTASKTTDLRKASETLSGKYSKTLDIHFNGAQQLKNAKAARRNGDKMHRYYMTLTGGALGNDVASFLRTAQAKAKRRASVNLTSDRSRRSGVWQKVFRAAQHVKNESRWWRSHVTLAARIKPLGHTTSHHSLLLRRPPFFTDAWFPRARGTDGQGRVQVCHVAHERRRQ